MNHTAHNIYVPKVVESITFRIPKDLRIRLKERAKKESRSEANVVRLAVEQYLGK